MSAKQENTKGMRWPENCIWPEPENPDALGSIWDPEDAQGMPLDPEGEELVEIGEYMDSLVEEGRLNPDYSLNEDYYEEDGEESEDGEEDAWEPEIGKDFWDGGFDREGWEWELLGRLNCLKTEAFEAAMDIREATGYEFVNENLMRQAFTRRAFAKEHGLEGDNEELEYIGDAVIGMVLSREIAERFLEVEIRSTGAPLQTKRKWITEGTLSKAREQYSNKEYLAARFGKLGLDKYILYGAGEQPTESSREDAMEALIGAVAVDSGWNWDVMSDVTNRLLEIQLDYPDRYLKKSHYEIFNAWHQRHFGRMPDYEVHEGLQLHSQGREYRCTIRFSAPENGKGIDRNQRIDVEADNRSKARELAAELAYHFMVRSGLWVRMEDAGITPRMEDSINQLQELYQKKYVDQPEYEFTEGTEWECECRCGGVYGWGRGSSKTAAKKAAAYEVLGKLMGRKG